MPLDIVYLGNGVFGKMISKEKPSKINGLRGWDFPKNKRFWEKFGEITFLGNFWEVFGRFLGTRYLV